MGFLPITKSVKKTDDPKNLIIFGLPKVDLIRQYYKFIKIYRI